MYNINQHSSVPCDNQLFEEGTIYVSAGNELQLPQRATVSECAAGCSFSHYFRLHYIFRSLVNLFSSSLQHTTVNILINFWSPFLECIIIDIFETFHHTSISVHYLQSTLQAQFRQHHTDVSQSLVRLQSPLLTPNMLISMLSVIKYFYRLTWTASKKGSLAIDTALRALDQSESGLPILW